MIRQRRFCCDSATFAFASYHSHSEQRWQKIGIVTSECRLSVQCTRLEFGFKLMPENSCCFRGACVTTRIGILQPASQPAKASKQNKTFAVLVYYSTVIAPTDIPPSKRRLQYSCPGYLSATTALLFCSMTVQQQQTVCWIPSLGSCHSGNPGQTTGANIIH